MAIIISILGIDNLGVRCANFLEMEQSLDFIEFEFDETDPHQALVAKYIRETGKTSDELMDNIIAYHLPEMLMKDPNATQEQINDAVVFSVEHITNQIKFLLTYFKLKHGIELSPEVLASMGLEPYQMVIDPVLWR
jgi:hypothetical protein